VNVRRARRPGRCGPPLPTAEGTTAKVVYAARCVPPSHGDMRNATTEGGARAARGAHWNYGRGRPWRPSPSTADGGRMEESDAGPGYLLRLGRQPPSTAVLRHRVSVRRDGLRAAA